MDRKRSWQASILVVASALATAPAYGQAIPAQPQAASAAAPQLGEIVVTAQRRSESLQKVPISITALSGKSLATKGVTATEDIASIAPGVTFTHQLITAAPSIRGISQSNGAPGDEPPTAIYVDGVYLATAQAAFFSFNNIDRIEILKGPQGTLFGRNAAAGVVNIITKTPSHRTALDASVDYGSYGTIEAKAYATGGITSDLAADIAVVWQHQADGWGTNIANGADAFKSQDLSIRSKLLWTPGDHTTVTLAADYGRSHTDVGVAQHLLEDGGAVGPRAFPGFYDINSNVANFIRYHQWGVSATVRQDMGWAQIKSISSYRAFRSHGEFDGDATPLPVQDILLNNPTDTATQEIQLLSPDANKVKWIAGAFFMHAKAGYDPLKIAGVTAIVGRQTTDSLSGFGQATIPLGDSSHLTGGLRYTKDWQQIQGGIYSYASHGFDNDGTLRGPPGPIGQRANFGKLTYKAAIDRQMADGLLGYASYSRGFKSGLFNTASPTSPALRPEIVDQYEIGLKSELFSRRLRLNLSAFIGRISGVQLQTIGTNGLSTLINAAREHSAGFDADFEAVVSRRFTLSGGLAFTHAIYSSFPNAPLFTPNPTPLCPGQTTGNCQTSFDASGRRAILTPRWAGNIGAEYRIPFRSGEIAVSGTYAYTSSIFWLPDNRIRQPANHIVNASVKWTSPDRHFDIAIWGRNLADQHIYLYENEKTAGDVGSPAAPRTVGVSLGVHLGS